MKNRLPDYQAACINLKIFVIISAAFRKELVEHLQTRGDSERMAHLRQRCGVMSEV